MIIHDAVGKLLTSLAILKISSLASCNCLVKDSQCVAVLCATCPTFTPSLGKTRCEKFKSDKGKFRYHAQIVPFAGHCLKLFLVCGARSRTLRKGRESGEVVEGAQAPSNETKCA